MSLIDFFRFSNLVLDAYANYLERHGGMSSIVRYVGRTKIGNVTKLHVKGRRGNVKRDTLIKALGRLSPHLQFTFKPQLPQHVELFVEKFDLL